MKNLDFALEKNEFLKRNDLNRVKNGRHRDKNYQYRE